MNYLFVIVMKHEDDSSREEDGDEADGETKDPVVTNSHVEVEGGEHGTPNHHIQHLVETN